MNPTVVGFALLALLVLILGAVVAIRIMTFRRQDRRRRNRDPLHDVYGMW